jgi:hypothetical protein
MSDRRKTSRLHTKLTKTAATEMKLLSALDRSVNSVISAALHNGASRISHGKIIFLAH